MAESDENLREWLRREGIDGYHSSVVRSILQAIACVFRSKRFDLFELRKNDIIKKQSIWNLLDDYEDDLTELGEELSTLLKVEIRPRIMWETVDDVIRDVLDQMKSAKERAI